MKAGEAFENEVSGWVRQALAQGELSLIARQCSVHLRTGYRSKERGDEIVVDVSIEVTFPGANDPWLIWVWECKDYSNTVPVNDVEEFHAKLDQIGADRTKGTIIARSGFQAGAVAYARSKGIGLARMLPDGQVKHTAHASALILVVLALAAVPWWDALVGITIAVIALCWIAAIVLCRGPRNESVVSAALTQPEFCGQGRRFYATMSNGYDGRDTIDAYVKDEFKDWGLLNLWRRATGL